MSEWRYECPKCHGKFHSWNVVKVEGGTEKECPFCGLTMGQYVPVIANIPFTPKEQKEITEYLNKAEESL